jgi:hypothetical protein
VLLVILGIAGFSCEKGDNGHEIETGIKNQLTNGFCITFHDSIIISHRDIDYYDHSTHLVYLKEAHPIFEDPFNQDLAYISFSTYAFKEEIYSGIIFPAWASSIPSGAFIQWPSFHPGYVIPIEYSPPPGNLEPDTLADPREDQRITEALQEYGQYHRGLALEIANVQFNTTGKVSFSYTLTNNDSFDYHVLSPEKMGTGLFHYFTNGLYLYNQETGWLQHQMPVQTPDPWDSWEANWLDRLNHSTSRTYHIEYDEFDPVPEGTYSLYFSFPGLSHVEQEDRILNGAVIWMGDLRITDEITIQ